MAIGAFQVIEELETELDVGGMEANEVAQEGERALGIVLKAGNGFAEHRTPKLAAIAAGGGEPAAEIFEIGELEAVE